jgi:hypothetical protein
MLRIRVADTMVAQQQLTLQERTNISGASSCIEAFREQTKNRSAHSVEQISRN